MPHHSPLPAFSFPALPQPVSPNIATSESQSEPVLSNVHKQGRKSHHRRNIATCIKRSSITSHTLSSTSDPSIPPVPKIPERYSGYPSPSKAATSQPLVRSLSDVSSCPTLEADVDPFTPDSLLGFGDPEEFFDKLRLSNPPDNTSIDQKRDLGEAYSGNESNTSQSENSEDNDGEDDEEFFHCRGLYDPSSTPTASTPISEQTKKDSDGFEIFDLPAPSKFAIDAYNSYEDWLRTVAQRAQFFDEISTDSISHSRDLNDYMGIIRNPLLA